MSNTVPEGKIITKKQKFFLTTTLVVGTSVAVVATLKYRGAIAAAKDAGLQEWLKELDNHNFDVIIATKDQIDKAFQALGEIAPIPAA